MIIEAMIKNAMAINNGKSILISNAAPATNGPIKLPTLVAAEFKPPAVPWLLPANLEK